ncbi:MAG: transglycosylase SLT domain-containing protein [Methylococcales bacterium]|nr:transglycosylase SLT domain-containing protein [Methylococcales bacterium]
MNIIINSTLRIIFLCSLALLCSTATSNTLEQQRQIFLLAEKLIERKDENAFLNLSATLADYPLYPYLQYQWLSNNLSQTDKIMAFISTYKDTLYADLLRFKWLNYLADHDRWNEIIQHYQASNDTALECRFYWAHYKTGDQLLALNAAKRLWTTGRFQPKACDPLLSAFVLSPVLTPELIWQRFELALKQENIPLAVYVQRLMDKPDQDIAEVWLQVHKKPELIEDSSFWTSNIIQQGRILAHGIDRMAKSDLDLAITLWDSKKGTVAIDTETVQRLERRLALALARVRDNRAYDRLNQLLNVDAEIREWKIRAALLEQNWQHVTDALAGLTPDEQKEPRWQYWQARSLTETGNGVQGQIIYNRLSTDRSFYGFMAADAIHKPYSLTDTPVFLADNELETLAGESDFKAIRELNFLNRQAEAQRQWWFAVKKLTKDRLKIAAKLAQQWQWGQVAIITLVKADYWDDLALRFPISYLSQVQSNAYRQNLDPAVVFGLIRQESMLDKNAQSAAGAKGLMQIMPATGRQIAHSLGEPWQVDSLFNPDINIKYGTLYYRQLLNQFDGQFALAIAAYNAGPNRVRKWLFDRKNIPADIWIETIPFKETRKYVTSVLSYSIIYQQRIQSNALKITNWLSDIRPS